MHSKPVRIILSVALAAWMVMIFCFSAQTVERSSGTSDSVIVKILELTNPDYPSMSEAEVEAVIDHYSHTVRKCAHFLEYLVLGALSAATLSAWVPGSEDKRRLLTVAILALLFSAFYSATDEIHQYFVPGRGCMISDVCLDSLGALTGCAVFSAVRLLIINKRKRSGGKKNER